MNKKTTQITSDDVWEIIKQLNPHHVDYPQVVTYLARFAKELKEKE